MEHSVGLPLCWCRDRGVRRNTRRGVYPGRCRDALPRRDRVAVAVPFPVAMSRLALRTFWWGTRQVTSLHSVTEGYTFMAVSWQWCQEDGRVLARPCMPLACLACRGLQASSSVWFLLCLPRLFARCLALEGLSRSEVVFVVWDPHPQEPVEGVLWATSMPQLAANLADSGAEGKMSHVVVLGVGPQLGQAAVMHAFVCLRGGSVSLFCGGEAGARLVSRGRGRRVPLLAASGGGLVAVVVTVFPHDTRASGGFHSVSSRFCDPVLGCQSVVASACVASRPRGVSRVRSGSVCQPLTLWRSKVAVLVVFGSVGGDANFGVPGGGPGGRAITVGVRLPCKFCVRTAVGCSCCCVACVASVVSRCVHAVVVRLVLDSLAVIFPVWRTVAGKSSLGLAGCEVWCIAWFPSVLGLRWVPERSEDDESVDAWVEACCNMEVCMEEYVEWMFGEVDGGWRPLTQEHFEVVFATEHVTMYTREAVNKQSFLRVGPYRPEHGN
ncbi:hypothetical protein Taro_056753 [Colocasia esculenta]|uniref:Uncharacterized protein n=1 Tax=Colocasia esculenta TaxID=4460 RepID=A0A843XWM7_COLES|nr:hypothetical protein [Colocasia esculenta]